ncbi:MAG: hypothetical protein MUF30_03815 [Burkholderiales bacterium]|jgi:hypothetical protein|nr:hypothetical protein [Burkholderiales bacterium]
MENNGHGLARAALAVVAIGIASTAAAHDLTAQECTEGSEFILHAAMARDEGMSRGEFIDRMEADLVAIRSFPPELRWFAQDPDDERLLQRAAEAVFDRPEAPETHQSAFLAQCPVGPTRGPATHDASL